VRIKLKAQIEAMEAELHAILRGCETQQAVVDLPSRSIDETQAADLRARLKTFSEDWDRPETAIYDQSPAGRCCSGYFSQFGFKDR
jgi:hypothetical protein